MPVRARLAPSPPPEARLPWSGGHRAQHRRASVPPACHARLFPPLARALAPGGKRQVPESSLAPCTGEGRSQNPTQRPGARRACWRLPCTSHGAAAESFFVYFIFTRYALWQLVLFPRIESCTQCTEYISDTPCICIIIQQACQATFTACRRRRQLRCATPTSGGCIFLPLFSWSGCAT